MPKFTATVSYTCRYEKTLEIQAKDEEAAVDKATEIVQGWKNVEDAEVVGIDEA